MKQECTDTGSKKLRPHTLLLPFELSTVTGEKIDSWSFKGQKSLVIYFFDPFQSKDWEFMAELRRRYSEITDNEAEVVAIGKGSRDEIAQCTESMHLPFDLLIDENNRIHNEYGVTTATVIVTDRYTEIRMVSETTGNIDELINNLLGTLDLATLECPECGVPTWPES